MNDFERRSVRDAVAMITKLIHSRSAKSIRDAGFGSEVLDLPPDGVGRLPERVQKAVWASKLCDDVRTIAEIAVGADDEDAPYMGMLLHLVAQLGFAGCKVTDGDSDEFVQMGEKAIAGLRRGALAAYGNDPAYRDECRSHWRERVSEIRSGGRISLAEACRKVARESRYTNRETGVAFDARTIRRNIEEA